MTHPLAAPAVVRAVERATSAHLGRDWTVDGLTDLADLASHPCVIFHGRPIGVFAKLDAAGPIDAEIRGLDLIRDRAGVAVPRRVAVLALDAGAVLLTEAVDEIPADRRSDAQWRSIGTALAALHAVRAEAFGLDFDGFFGPLPQDNRPVPGNVWADFYAERRLRPLLRRAVDSGHLPADLAAGVERVIGRLPDRCGPEPRPSLLHGDAQRNNFLTTAASAVLLDVAPYFGHPEIDLALLDYFAPVPDAVFHAYADRAPVDPGFAERRELWRLPGYLAVVAVDGGSEFGRPFLSRIAEAVARYR
jgi:fructosamine-3-kinase